MLYQIKVNNLERAEVVRTIRNQVRKNMTGDSTFISAEKQIEWFERSKPEDLYLYRDDDGVFVGYGYISMRYGYYYLTLGVIPTEQNKGYGTIIYNNLTQLVRDKYQAPTYIEIFSDNNPSLIAALKAGFTIYGANDKTVLLVKG